MILYTSIKGLRSYKQNWSIRRKEGKTKGLLFQIVHFSVSIVDSVFLSPILDF